MKVWILPPDLHASFAAAIFFLRGLKDQNSVKEFCEHSPRISSQHLAGLGKAFPVELTLLSEVIQKGVYKMLSNPMEVRPPPPVPTHLGSLQFWGCYL